MKPLEILHVLIRAGFGKRLHSVEGHFFRRGRVALSPPRGGGCSPRRQRTPLRRKPGGRRRSEHSRGDPPTPEVPGPGAAGPCGREAPGPGREGGTGAGSRLPPRSDPPRARCDAGPALGSDAAPTGLREPAVGAGRARSRMGWQRGPPGAGGRAAGSGSGPEAGGAAPGVTWPPRPLRAGGPAPPGRSLRGAPGLSPPPARPCYSHAALGGRVRCRHSVPGDQPPVEGAGNREVPVVELRRARPRLSSSPCPEPRHPKAPHESLQRRGPCPHGIPRSSRSCLGSGRAGVGRGSLGRARAWWSPLQAHLPCPAQVHRGRNVRKQTGLRHCQRLREEYK
ncbi:basic proline-rich protein-like [Pseudopipra pipra]|uniref:basic proline-rich protein-like n=1 Tax=Pseudopipra pipra TaxID=415032 RepID=UPI0031386B5A